MASKNIYVLKDLAFVSGHSVETLKYYLKIKLIHEVAKGPETNFRFFDDSTVETLKQIRELRLEGHSLEQIRQTLSAA